VIVDMHQWLIELLYADMSSGVVGVAILISVIHSVRVFRKWVRNN
jgi:hypothetical protein